MCPARVFGGHTQARWHFLPWQCHRNSPGSQWSRWHWAGCGDSVWQEVVGALLPVPAHKDGFDSLCSESLLTHSHHHGPSACAGLWLLLRAQGGFHTHPGLPSISGSLWGEPWIHGSSGVHHVMKLCVQFPPWPGLEYFFPPVQWRNLFRPSSPCRGNPVLF